MSTMIEIEELCKRYAAARDKLDDTVEGVREEQRKAARQKMRPIKRQAADVAAARDALFAAIEESPELFEKPRTVPFHGVTVGFRKQPGKLECDEARSIALIRKKLPDRAEGLIKVSEKIVAAALRKLPAKDLAAVGAAIVEPDDEVVIKVARSDLDRIVAALIEDAGENAR